VRLASRGLRDLGGGPEAILDPEERGAVRRQARGVALRAAVVTAAVTALALLIP